MPYFKLRGTSYEIHWQDLCYDLLRQPYNKLNATMKITVLHTDTLL